MIALMILAYLLAGFIQSSLLHKYFWPMHDGLTFIMLSIGWPIATVVFGLGILGEGLNDYLKWLRKDKQ